MKSPANYSFGRRPAALGFAALVAVAVQSADASLVTATWTGPAVGSWSTPANWSSGTVPNNGGGTTYNAIVDGLPGQSTLALLSTSVQIQNLTVNSGDSLYILSGSILGVAGGSIVNNGTFNPTASEDVAWLRLDANTTLSGNGSMTGSNIQLNRIYGANGTVRLTHSAEHTIQGSMQIGNNALLLTNNGTIDANASSGMTIDLADGGSSFNNGTIRATNGGKILVTGTTLNNELGLVEAGAGTIVDFNFSTVIGGFLRDTDGLGSGILRNLTSLTLQDVTIQGQLSTINSATTRINGTLTVQDRLTLDAAGTNTTLSIESPVCTLTGGGELALSANLFNRIAGLDAASRLVVGPGFWIHGAGQFGLNSLVLTNNGIIEADSTHELIMALSLDGQNINNSTIRAVDGASLQIRECTIDNTYGVIESDVNSFVTFDDCIISGGIIRSIPGKYSGVLQTLSAASLLDVTIQGEFTVYPGALASGLTLQDSAIQGTLIARPGTKTYLSGIVEVDGTINLNPFGGTATISVLPPFAMLGGTGTTILGGTSTGTITGTLPTAHLFIGPEHTVSGRGYVGAGMLRITNFGTLEAVGTAGFSDLIIEPSPETEFRNEGLIRATQGSIQLSIGTFVNSGDILVGAGKGLKRSGDFTQTAGNTTVDGTMLVQTGDLFLHDGTVEVNGSLDQSTRSFHIDGGELRGKGSVKASVVSNSQGTVSPGPDGTVGMLTVIGDYQQTSGGTLSVQIGGPVPAVQYDQLVVQGGVTVGVPDNPNQGGTLRVTRVNGFVPTPEQRFRVLTWQAPSLVEFSSVESCDGIVLEPLPFYLNIGFPGPIGPAGDLDHDGAVTGADLGMLLGSWGACSGLCCADLTGDGTVDGADLGTLLGNWN